MTTASDREALRRRSTSKVTFDAILVRVLALRVNRLSNFIHQRSIRGSVSPGTKSSMADAWLGLQPSMSFRILSSILKTAVFKCLDKNLPLAMGNGLSPSDNLHTPSLTPPPPPLSLSLSLSFSVLSLVVPRWTDLFVLLLDPLCFLVH